MKTRISRIAIAGLLGAAMMCGDMGASYAAPVSAGPRSIEAAADTGLVTEVGRRRRGDAGAALALGALGVIAGAAIANAGSDRYYGDGYYGRPAYGYRYYQPYYYYDAPAYYHRPRVYYRPRHYYRHAPRVHFRHQYRHHRYYPGY